MYFVFNVVVNSVSINLVTLLRIFLQKLLKLQKYFRHRGGEKIILKFSFFENTKNLNLKKKRTLVRTSKHNKVFFFK